MAPEKAGENTFWEHVYRYRFATRYVKNKRVLDIACGEGYGTSALLFAGALSVIGVDISSAACDHAKKKYHIDVRVGDAMEIPLLDRSVDVIVSFETIEHLSDPDRFLSESIRVLSPKGRMIISTPNKVIYDSIDVKNDFHLNELNLEDFVQLLQKYYSRIQLFSQMPQSPSWFSKRPLASPNSPWLRLKGMHRLRRFLMKLTCPKLLETDKYRGDVVKIVNKRENPFSALLNPYLVVKSISENPIFILALADL